MLDMCIYLSSCSSLSHCFRVLLQRFCHSPLSIHNLSVSRRHFREYFHHLCLLILKRREVERKGKGSLSPFHFVITRAKRWSGSALHVSCSWAVGLLHVVLQAVSSLVIQWWERTVLVLELLLLLLLLQKLLLLLQEEFVWREKYQILWAVSLTRAGQTENGSPHEKETRRDEGYVNGTARLKLVAFGHIGV